MRSARLRALVPLGILVLSLATASAGDVIGRLGSDVVPVSQSVRLEVDPREADYHGEVEIAVEVRRTVASFRFHAEAMTLERAELRPSKGGSPIALATAPGEQGVVTATAAAPIPTGSYTLDVAFKNDFDTHALGLYRLQSEGRWYAFTQFEAVDGRKAFPCWDEPSFKIPFQVTLTVPAEDAAFSNTPEERSTTAGGRRTVVFRRTRPLPSYLVAIATGPLETVPIPGTSVPARVIVPKGSAALAADAVAMTPPILAALERYFGSRMPYDKVDLIAVPEYWYGAMENPGLITFRDNVLLLDHASASDDDREELAGVVGHELAHMWFGDLVTMAWWDDLWLNESFASWMEGKITAEIFPQFQSRVDDARGAQRIMAGDSLQSTRTMRQRVDSVASLLQSADGLAYRKGATVLAMTETWLTPDTFRAGVLAYLKTHADATATADDLWNALAAASKKDVKGVLSSFLDQPGVPIVAVAPVSRGKVRLAQARFLSSGAKTGTPQTWRIPLILEYPDGPEMRSQRVLLDAAEKTVKLESRTTPAWILPNGDEAAYTRWALPPDQLAAVARDATTRLSPRERIGLLGNASAMFKTGGLSGSAYLDLLSRLASDPEPLVLKSVIGGVDEIHDSFFAEAEDPAFAAWVRRTLRPAFDRMGPLPRPGESAAATSVRPDLVETLADWGEDEEVAASMSALAAKYMDDPDAVPPSLARTAITTAARRGDARLFEAYRKRFEQAKVPTERSRFLAGLASFEDPALVDRALAYVFTGPIRPQETLTVPRIVAAHPAGRERVWTWMTVHYPELTERVPGDFRVFFPRFAAGCSELRLAAAKTFFAAPEHAPPGTEKELAKVDEGVSNCARLSAREGSAVRRYLAAPQTTGETR